MDIFQEIDAALRDETAKLAIAPRDTQFLIVLSSGARNDLFQQFLYHRDMTTPGTLSEQKWRGNVIATTADPDMPRVSIFTKAKEGPWKPS